MTCSVENVSSETAEKIMAAAQVDRMRVKDLKVRRLQDVVGVPILGYAGIYENENAIGYTYFNSQLRVAEHFSAKGMEGVGEIDEPVFFLGKYNICWGHCITDGMKFLWPFLDLDKHPYLQNCKVVYTTLGQGDELPPNFLELLKLFGINESRLVRLRRVTRLRECYLADECFGADGQDRWFTPEYRALIQYVCQRCKECQSATGCSHKLYLSRRAWKCDWVTGEFGEQHLEEAFRRSGFEVLYPERVPFREFVCRLQQADEVSATECSSSHNALFMSPGAKMILLRKLDRINLYQLAINQVADLAAVYVDVGKPLVYTYPQIVQRGPFFMYVTKHLADYLGVRPHFPVGTLLKYIGHACYMKSYWVLHDFAYCAYKMIVVRGMGITRWEKGKII